MSSEPTHLLIARHGETQDNAAQRWQGWNDSALTERGVAQAEALGRYLAHEPLAAAYCSDLGRAIETVRIAAASHNLMPRTDTDLRERDAGLFSGLTGPELQGQYAEDMAARREGHTLDWSPPEGESLRLVLARVVPAIDRIAARWSGQTILVVTHGGVVRLLATYADGEDWEHLWDRHPSNCGLSRFTWHSPGHLTLDSFDEHGFLEE